MVQFYLTGPLLIVAPKWPKNHIIDQSPTRKKDDIIFGQNSATLAKVWPVLQLCTIVRVSVQEVKSLGHHFACLFREFDFYEVKKKYYYF